MAAMGVYLGEEMKRAFEMLVEVTRELGRAPTFEEARLDPRLPDDPNVFSYYFGSFSAACEKAEYRLKVEAAGLNPPVFKPFRLVKPPKRLWSIEKAKKELEQKRIEAEKAKAARMLVGRHLSRSVVKSIKEVIKVEEIKKEEATVKTVSREEAIEKLSALCKEQGRLPDFNNLESLNPEVREYIKVIGGDDTGMVKKEILDWLWMAANEDGTLRGRPGRKPMRLRTPKEEPKMTDEEVPAKPADPEEVSEPVKVEKEKAPEPTTEKPATKEVPEEPPVVIPVELPVPATDHAPDKPVTIQLQLTLTLKIEGAKCSVEVT